MQKIFFASFFVLQKNLFKYTTLWVFLKSLCPPTPNIKIRGVTQFSLTLPERVYHFLRGQSSTHLLVLVFWLFLVVLVVLVLGFWVWGFLNHTPTPQHQHPNPNTPTPTPTYYTNPHLSETTQ